MVPLRQTMQEYWVSPEQDINKTIKPVLISPINGVMGYTNIAWDRIKLPRNVPLQLWQFGVLNPVDLGLVGLKDQWLPITDFFVDGKLFHIYDELGRMYPLHEIMVYRGRDNNILLCMPDRIWKSYGSGDLIYNIYANFSHRNKVGPKTDVYSTTYITGVEYGQLLEASKDWDPNQTILYKNGFKVDRFLNMVEGDHITAVFDSSITKKFTIDVSDLNYFESTLGEVKYVIHLPKAEIGGQIIYVDDCRFYYGGTEKSLIDIKERTRIRNLTHQDFSLPTLSLTKRKEKYELVDLLQLEIILRKPAYDRPLYTEANRICDLYLCNDDTIKAVLGGHLNTVERWNPKYLETSTFSKFLECKNPTTFSTEDYAGMLGYQNLARILGNPIAYPDYSAGFRAVPIPELLMKKYTVFEYNVDGKLIGISSGEDRRYHMVSEDCTMVEIFHGIGNSEYGDHVGDWPITDSTYRVYKSEVVNGKVLENYVDVTETIDYTPIDGVLVWKFDPLTEQIMVRSDEEFFLREYDYDYSQGAMVITIESKNMLNGKIYNENNIPWQNVLVWMNGYPLIQNIDFKVDGSKVYIYNTKHLIKDQLQKITVVGRGLGQDLETIVDQGWTVQGHTSRNETINTDNGRLLRVNIGGKIHDIRNIEDGDFADLLGQLENGLPYSYEEYLQPCYYDNIDPYKAMSEERKWLDRTQAFVNAHRTETPISGIVTIPKRWVLHSPLLNQVLYDLKNDRLKPEDFNINDYGDLLNNDPTKLDSYDPRFVTLYPWVDVTSLTIKEYNLMVKINQFHLGGNYNLRNFFEIKG